LNVSMMSSIAGVAAAAAATRVPLAAERGNRMHVGVVPGRWIYGWGANSPEVESAGAAVGTATGACLVVLGEEVGLGATLVGRGVDAVVAVAVGPVEISWPSGLSSPVELDDELRRRRCRVEALALVVVWELVLELLRAA
jgi:hypothetical protein